MTNATNNNSMVGFMEHQNGMLASCAGVRDDIGQALVELALVFPIFILLLIGAAEFGRLAYAAIEVTNAAHAAALYGAYSHITASDTAGMQLIATTDASAPNVTSMTVTPTQFCSCSTGGTIVCSTALISCPSPARIIESVQVNTIASVDTLFHFPGIPKTVTLTGQAIMRVEQ